MRKIDYKTMFFALMGSFLVLFIFLPIVNMIFSTTPDTLIVTLQDRQVLDAIFVSIFAACASTLIAIVFGVPLAYVLARNDFYGKGFVEAIIDVPVVIPHTVVGIALLLMFSASGPLGAPLGQIGLEFSDTIYGVIIAMLFVSGSFVVNSTREGMENVDPRMEKVARTLGCGSFKTFFIITLPLSIRSIIVGALMSWARAISEFGALVILAYYPIAAPILIYQRFMSFGLTDSTPVAVILILICLMIFIFVRFISSGWNDYDKA